MKNKFSRSDKIALVGIVVSILIALISIYSKKNNIETNEHIKTVKHSSVVQENTGNSSNNFNHINGSISIKE